MTEAPRLVLGADTLCWHLRLERGDLSLEQLLGEAAEAGAEYVQLTLHHARDRTPADLEQLAGTADELGMHVLASGDFLGGARFGDAPEAALERVRGWLERAVALASPILRVTSSFYRAELAGIPGAIEAERRWAIAALAAALPAARGAGGTLALENHSDFTAAEYRSILDEVGDARVAIVLDVIHTVAALDDPGPGVHELLPLAVAGDLKACSDDWI